MALCRPRPSLVTELHLQIVPRKSSLITLILIALLLSSTAAGCGSEAPQEGPSLSVTEATSEQCAFGGQIILLGETEHVICQGAPGADGLDSTSPEIEVTEATAGRKTAPGAAWS